MINNEKLEFLGDRVIGLVLSKKLSLRFSGFFDKVNNISLHLSASDFKRPISLAIDELFKINLFSFKSFKTKKIVFKGVLNSCAAAALKAPISDIFFWSDNADWVSDNAVDNFLEELAKR